MRAHMPNQSELAGGRSAPEQWARIDPTIYITAARRLQARAMAELIGAGWRHVRRGVAGLAGLARRLVAPIAKRSQRRRALAALAAMDDRLLADVGLRRSDIELAVDGRLADPRVTRRAPAAPAPAQPDRVSDLAA
jgi:uncharacterized protein YjiS (DUF1127 family)